MTNANTNTPDITVNFYDNYVPKLKDGNFTVTVAQTLAVNGNNPGNIPTQPQAPISQQFIVRGPRFALTPGMINQEFPPAGSVGDYHQFLPQLVLNQQSLPWERDLNLPASTANIASIPWLALLVFAEGELSAPNSQPTGSQSNPTQSTSVLLGNAVNASFNNTPTAGPPAGTLAATLTLEADEDPTQLYCNVIDIPTATFNSLMPSINDLSFMAHTRQVSLQNKAISQGQQTSNWFSTVIANRFAVPPSGSAQQTSNIVHLVSLEGFENHLSQNGVPNVTGYQKVRMISLYSWTYTSCTEPGENFSTLMLNLIASSNPGIPPDLLLRLPLPNPPVTPPDPKTTQAVKARLEAGYVPLSHAMLSGDQSFAWYRSPFSPVPVNRFINSDTPLTTSEAMIFETTTGIFDQSYASAFQTGRSLALASKSFTQSLMNWQSKAHRVVDLILEYMNSPVYAPKMRQDGLLDAGGNLTATGVTDLAALLDAKIVTQAFQDFFATDIYHSIAKKIGTQGGFSAADNSLIIHQALPVKVPATEPQDLLTLMQQPVIINLLQQLAGLDNLGTLGAPLQAGATSLFLAIPGITEAISDGSPLLIYSPDGSSSTWVTVSGNVSANSTTIAIAAYNGSVSLPVGSSLTVSDSFQDADLVVDWLASITLLNNVPFNNLVAHPKLLQQESIRFFYLDQNWTDALLDGALSVGIQTGRDAVFQCVMKDKLFEGVQAAMAEVRGTLLGENSLGQTPVAVSPSGFLLRSKSIIGWPGLEIRAWSVNDTVNPMKPLRLALLSSDVLIAIYPDIPVKLEFTEPSEGLVFGIEDNGVDLRYIPGVTGYTTANIGKLIGTPSLSIAAAYRNGINSALTINSPTGNKGLVQLIEQTLPGHPTLTPASFAVQMVCVPEQMLFTPATEENL